MNAFHDLLDRLVAASHGAANYLYDKGDDIKKNEACCKGRGTEPEKGMRRHIEVDEAAEDGVCEGIDP